MARSPYGAARNAADLDDHTSAPNAASQDHSGKTMAKVMVSMKIYPAEVVSDMSQLQDRIRKTLEGSATVYKFEEEPVAFGLVALVAHILMPEDVDGRMDEVEQRLKSMEGISEVQVLVSRRV